MNTTFYYIPDAGNTSDNATINPIPAPLHTPVRHLGNVPTKDADLDNVATAVATKWEAENWFIVRYMKQDDFANNAKRFNELLQQRTEAGGGTHGLSTDMHELDKEADDAIPYVKNFAFGIWGAKLAKDHYGEFGIEHHSSGYELPDDRNKQKIAFETMINALQKYNITTVPYGANWWTDYLTRYNEAMGASEGSDKTISGYVGELNQLRTSLRRTLQSVLYILEGNYPDTFEQERRVWGFLKDRY